jgi:hypothetical protein
VIEGDEDKVLESLRDIRRVDREIVRLEHSGATERQTASLMKQNRVELAERPGWKPRTRSSIRRAGVMMNR